MVYQFLTKEAEHCLSLLKMVPPSAKSTEAVAGLEKYLSELAGAAFKGEVDKDKGVQGFIGRVYRLIELTYESCPSCPRVTSPTTEEEFVTYFMDLGHHAPEIAGSFAFMDEADLGHYLQAADSDKVRFCVIFRCIVLQRCLLQCIYYHVL